MADQKISQLTADTTPTSDDLVVVVNDPAGTPGTKKVTLANLFTAAWTYLQYTIVSFIMAGMPDGSMWNGKIAVSVASNDLTVALKTKAGTDASASDPIYIMINGTLRTCTAALSKTLADGTQWFALGAAFATLEQDFFAYAIWNTTPATDIVDLGFARLPTFKVYSDASGTTTNERYLASANASAPTSTDDMVVIGRFAATLSATAAFNWSVPTFTSKNLIQYPIYETRWRNFVPTPTGFSVLPTTVMYRFKVVNNVVHFPFSQGVMGTSSTTAFTIPLPFTAATVTNGNWFGTLSYAQDNTASFSGGMWNVASAGSVLTLYKAGFGTWTASGDKGADGYAIYEIA